VGWQVCDNDFKEINKTHMKNGASFVLPTQNGKQGYSSSPCGIQETKTKENEKYGGGDIGKTKPEMEKKIGSVHDKHR